MVTMGSQFIHHLNALFVLPRNFTMKIKREQRKYNIRPVGAINPSYIMKSLKTSSFTS